MKVLLVGLGGFLGSAARYGVGVLAERLWPAALLPWATLIVNALGSGILGLLIGASAGRGWLGPDLRALLLVGVLGGFTTFSTFAYESVALGQEAPLGRAILNVALNVGGCLVAAWIGLAVGRSLWGGS